MAVPAEVSGEEVALFKDRPSASSTAASAVWTGRSSALEMASARTQVSHQFLAAELAALLRLAGQALGADVLDD